MHHAETFRLHSKDKGEPLTDFKQVWNTLDFYLVNMSTVTE